MQDSELSTRGTFAAHANGGREEFNNLLLDGVYNNDLYSNRYVMEPPVDSIQEFKFATGSYSAEYGRSAAGQVNVVTRGGANDLHGLAYEYFRNRSLDAANAFDAGYRNKYDRNQFGGLLGGPIVRGRAFFFVNIDALTEAADSPGSPRCPRWPNAGATSPRALRLPSTRSPSAPSPATSSPNPA